MKSPEKPNIKRIDLGRPLKPTETWQIGTCLECKEQFQRPVGRRGLSSAYKICSEECRKRRIRRQTSDVQKRLNSLNKAAAKKIKEDPIKMSPARIQRLRPEQIDAYWGEITETLYDRLYAGKLARAGWDA